MCTFYIRIALVVCVSELFKLVRYTRIVTVRARHIVLILIKYNFVCLVFYGAFIKCAPYLRLSTGYAGR